MPELYEQINTEKNTLKRYAPEVINIPQYILNNVKYNLFDWQKEALENFLVYEKDHRQHPTHLMFNMATGTGKTLVMASLILYYYQRGYRYFIFFVNQNNIVDKTENNFINSTHNKYLFTDKIDINGQIVNIKKVDNFSDDSPDIQIKFITIQKLYNDIHIEKENNITLEELYKRDVVMLADEAHHLNTNTNRIQNKLNLNTELKDNSSKEEVEKKGWEHTVIELILKKNGRKSNNVLLEFTATMPTEPLIVEKYKDKIIYKFGLKDFLKKGYTKEINLIGSTFNKKERILHALLFNWYRHKIALKNNIHNFKPVILFRSKTIEQSEKDYNFFLNLINNINIEDFAFLKKIKNKIIEKNNPYEQGRSRTEDVLHFIENEKVGYSEIIKFIKDGFQEKNLIITNSKDKDAKGKRGEEKTTDEQNTLLNNLEDKNNHIRGIFTVKRLTEGWDVLNLFDIVRLYEGQNVGGTHHGKTPETTIQEKQLIGRGVRYYPFVYKDKQKNKRKFDKDLKNELRVLEELYYYTFDDPNDTANHNYIIELKKELRKDGYIDDNRIVKTFNLKDSFKDKTFYKKVKIWRNRQKDNPDKQKNNLTTLSKDFFSSYLISGISLTEEWMKSLDNKESMERLNLMEQKLKIINNKTFKDFDYHIFRKAINIKTQKENSFYRFSNLKNNLKIKSIDDLLKDNFFGSFKINIVIEQNKNFKDIENDEKLKILLKFLNDIENKLKSYIKPKIGTKEFKAYKFSDIFGKPKTKSIEKKAVEETEELANVLKSEKWYILNDFVGTDQEIELIKFIQERIGNLKEKYEECYLLRNEEVYKIYNFEDGMGFQPDFLLLLKGKQDKAYYQIFVEPKGKQYLGENKDNSESIKSFEYGKEGWKEKFLEKINEEFGNKKILKAENKDYKLFGLPFFNSEDEFRNEFEEEFNKLIN